MMVSVLFVICGDDTILCYQPSINEKSCYKVVGLFTLLIWIGVLKSFLSQKVPPGKLEL